MTKQQRYAIHYTIIGLIVLIFTILAVSTGSKFFDDNIKYPEVVYEETAKGVITSKFKRGDAYYVLINGKEERVQYSVIQNNEIGSTVTLQQENGIKGSQAVAIIFMWITIIFWCIVAFLATIEAFDRYFKWLKGK